MTPRRAPRPTLRNCPGEAAMTPPRKASAANLTAFACATRVASATLFIRAATSAPEWATPTGQPILAKMLDASRLPEIATGPSTAASIDMSKIAVPNQYWAALVRSGYRYILRATPSVAIA